MIWTVDYAVIPGSPTDPKTFDAAEEYLDRPIRSPHGVEIKLFFVAVDMGNWAREVKIACHQRAGKGWIAVKGSSTLSAPLISPPRRHDFRAGGKKIRGGGRHHMVGVSDAKDTLLTRLASLPEQAESERWFHFPRDLPLDFIEHLCSEWKDPATGRWTPIVRNARNEGLDIVVYAWAVAHLPDRLRLGRLTSEDWELARNALRCEGAETRTDEPEPGPKPEPKAARSPGDMPRAGKGRRITRDPRRGKSYINSWR